MTTVLLSKVGEKQSVVISGTEATITIQPLGQFTGMHLVMFVCATDWIYHSVAAQSDGMPVKANQGLTMELDRPAGFTFYAKLASGSDTLHVCTLR